MPDKERVSVSHEFKIVENVAIESFECSESTFDALDGSS